MTLSRFLALAAVATGEPVKVINPPSAPLCCGWERQVIKTSPLDVVQFALLLNEEGQDQVRQVAKRVSDPTHVSYGNYLTREALDAMTAPKEGSLKAVLAWLGGTLDEVSWEVVRGRWIKVSCSVQLASKLLNTTFTNAKKESSAGVRPLAGAYSLPSGIVADSIASIYGLHGVPVGRKSLDLSSSAPRANSPPPVTPAILNQLYNISGVTASAGSGNKQAVVGFLGQTVSKDDLKTFFKK